MTGPDADGRDEPNGEPEGVRQGAPDVQVDDDVAAVIEQLEDLEETVDHPDERREVRRAISLVDRLRGRVTTDDLIRKFTRRDVAEAFVGSILVSLPLLVEDGVYDIAAHFVATPLFVLVNVAFVTLVTAGLLYYADFRTVRVRDPILGVFPHRLAAVLLVAFATATFTMTLWGRVDGWTDPLVAVSRISVVWVAASFGAALGDILPGESRGPDLTEEIDGLGERFGIGDDEGLF